jgi:hypothetical protein
MDRPVTGPANVQNNLQAQLNTRKIHGDFDAGKAPIPAHPGRSSVSPTHKTQGVPPAGPAETHIERVLPLPILERPALAQTEWAWRRLLIQLLSSSAQAIPSESSGVDPRSVPSGPQTVAAQTEVGETESLPVAAETQASEATSLPGAPDQLTVLRTLWNMMVNLAATRAQDEWHTPWNQAVTKFICLPFSELKAHHLESLPEKVQRWVLSDRLQSAVQTASSLTTGEGVLLIPQATKSTSDVGEAIRWKAERRSKPGANGVLIHRLRIECRVGASPVEFTITFAKPYLMVHAATNDTRLRDDFEGRGRQLVERLEAMGVRVERFSVGPLSDDVMTVD